MEQLISEPVNNTDTIIDKCDKTIEKSSWKPLFRQIVICSGVWNSFFTVGICQGGPTVIIPQLRREANSTYIVSEEMASWISSIHGYAALPWFVLPFLSSRIGRKYPFLIVSIISLISFIVLFCSVTTTHILIAECMQAPLFAYQMTVSIMIVIEYSSPKHRGLFLTLKSASANWGMLVANTIGTFFFWKYIAVAGMVCSFYNILLVFFMCESPSWLASKHRYEECTKVHKWLKGKNTESEKELAALLKSCKNYQDTQDEEMYKKISISKRFYKTALEKAFYKPILIGVGTLSLYYSCGKMVCSVYAIDIIKNITSDESTAYIGMLLLDVITVSGMYIGSGLTKIFKRRTLLLTGSCGGICFLFILASYLYLIKLKLIVENKHASLAILTLFFLFISFGPIILSSSIYGEVIPLRYRTAGMFVVGLYTEIILSTTLKTAPLIFKTFDMCGAFLFYATISVIIIYLLYKFLPETKDKTLQEIEELFVGPVDVKKNNLLDQL